MSQEKIDQTSRIFQKNFIIEFTRLTKFTNIKGTSTFKFHNLNLMNFSDRKFLTFVSLIRKNKITKFVKNYVREVNDHVH